MTARKTFSGLMLAILLAQAAWILAMPAFRGPDEFDHVYRAEGVTHGAIMPGRDEPRYGRGELTPARTSVIEAASGVCSQYPYTLYYNCHAWSEGKGTWNSVFSGAGRYNPSYYLVVGTVGRFFDGVAVDYAIRITTALICALLLAWAGTLWVRTGTSRWLTLGMITALTPVFLFSTTIAAPNGVSYAAGLLFWVAGLAMLRSPDAPARSELAAAAVGAVLLCNTHTTGPLWLLLITLALIGLEPARALGLVRDRRTWLTAAVIGAGGLASVAWTVVSGANVAKVAPIVDEGPKFADFFHNQIVWLLQTIAAFPLRNESAPGSVYVLWLIPFISLLVLALRQRGKVFIMTTAVAVGSIVTSVVLTIASFRTAGYAWQGRYSLPLVVGIALIPTAYRTSRPLRAFFDCAVLSMAAASAISVAHIAHQERHFLLRPWSSYLTGGPIIVAVLAAVSVLLMAGVLNRSLRDQPAPAETASTP